MSVEIKGLDSLRRKLQSLGGELEQATEKGVEKATKTVQTAAKLLCPVDTGYLRESIQTSFAWQPLGRIRRHGRYDCGIRPVCRIRHRADGRCVSVPTKRLLVWVS